MLLIYIFVDWKIDLNLISYLFVSFSLKYDINIDTIYICNHQFYGNMIHWLNKSLFYS